MSLVQCFCNECREIFYRIEMGGQKYPVKYACPKCNKENTKKIVVSSAKEEYSSDSCVSKDSRNFWGTVGSKIG